MQTAYTGFVDRSEWRWTTLVSLAFILFTFSPFVIMAFSNPIQSDTQFMGALHDYQDAATQITRMQQGTNGQILLDFLYSPQDQDVALVHPLYAILGQLVSFSQLSATIMFHVLRIFVSLFMYLTIYHLGANIWVKIRARRIFFILASVGAGFGWVATLFFGVDAGSIPDLSLPQAFPLYASAANIHYPLGIACVALITAAIVVILRPGETIKPSAQNTGSVVFIASLILALVYPDALIPLGIAYTLNVIANWYVQRKITKNEWYWGLWILVPALPIVTYDLITVMNNDFVANWITQRGDDLPSIWLLAISLGIPLIIAVPSLLRAVRRFEPDGDRFMLLWLGAMLISSYLPLQLNQYLMLGLLIPIAYFATRSAEDYWFTFIRRVHRPRVFFALFPLLILSHILWVFLPIFPMIQGWDGFSKRILEQEYGNVLIWVDESVEDETVILASPDVSLWIPAWTGTRVVYGHPDETYNASEALASVEEWYQATDPSAEICADLIDVHEIEYVIVGSRERRLGSSVENSGACTENLRLIQIVGSIDLYATEYAD